VRAAADSTCAKSVGLICHQIGPGAPLSEAGRPWADVYGITSTGAVIVRPDGYVLARFATAPADPVQALDRVLEQVLGQEQPC
jgi:hypothetical protein